MRWPSAPAPQAPAASANALEMEPDLYRRQLMLAENHQSPFFDARRARLASVKDVIEAQRARWAAAVDLERATGVAVLEATVNAR